MKKSIVICLLLTISVTGFSQQANHRYEKGYGGNVAVGIAAGYGFTGMLTTSHGYNFGNGVFLGAGTGVMTNLYDVIDIPLFTHLRYSFIPKKVSPFIGAKAGITYFLGRFGLGLTLSPEIGINIGKVSLGLGYMFERFDGGSIKIDYAVGYPVTVRSRYNIHWLNFTVSYDF